MKNLLFLLIIAVSLTGNMAVFAKGQTHTNKDAYATNQEQHNSSEHANEAPSEHDQDHAEDM